MTDAGFTLFDEFAARFARGDDPSVRDYLERAGSERDNLAAMIDAFLARAEPVAPDEEAIDVARALVAGHPPLLELRKRRGIRVDEIVDSLVSALKIDKAKRGKVKDYYQQLEGGLLEPAGVDRTVWQVLARQLGNAVRELASWRPPEAPAGVVYSRAMFAEDSLAHERLRRIEPSYEPDEVDLLFAAPDRPRRRQR